MAETVTHPSVRECVLCVASVDGVPRVVLLLAQVLPAGAGSIAAATKRSGGIKRETQAAVLHLERRGRA